ncbi:histidine phosphatase family protein [Lysobacter korlensis]|uniref:Histidine phosphatase family protein n=1 Tax=Lysobacter korlensis TaxID=553636 RepID=A0ABV6RWN1_9GAMM
MTLLYLVRHGETDWNAERRIQGSSDIPLNDTGRRQATAAGRLLARREWDGILASPLIRALDTARLISSEVGLGEPEIVPAFVERNYGEAEGLTGDEVDARYPDGAPVPGRETRGEVAERVLPELLALAAARPGQALLVVSHGGVIRAVLDTVEPGMKIERIPNGSVHSFRVEDGTLELIEFDDPLEAETDWPGSEDITEQNRLEREDAIER